MCGWLAGMWHPGRRQPDWDITTSQRRRRLFVLCSPLPVAGLELSMRGGVLPARHHKTVPVGRAVVLHRAEPSQQRSLGTNERDTGQPNGWDCLPLYLHNGRRPRSEHLHLSRARFVCMITDRKGSDSSKDWFLPVVRMPALCSLLYLSLSITRAFFHRLKANLCSAQHSLLLLC